MGVSFFRGPPKWRFALGFHFQTTKKGVPSKERQTFIHSYCPGSCTRFIGFPLEVIRHFGIVGEANIQYALDPHSSRSPGMLIRQLAPRRLCPPPKFLGWVSFWWSFHTTTSKGTTSQHFAASSMSQPARLPHRGGERSAVPQQCPGIQGLGFEGSRGCDEKHQRTPGFPILDGVFFSPWVDAVGVVHKK